MQFVAAARTTKQATNNNKITTIRTKRQRQRQRYVLWQQKALLYFGIFN